MYQPAVRGTPDRFRKIIENTGVLSRLFAVLKSKFLRLCFPTVA
jgi:hypothetical protein